MFGELRGIKRYEKYKSKDIEVGINVSAAWCLNGTVTRLGFVLPDAGLQVSNIKKRAMIIFSRELLHPLP